jgi:hypothetical protein
MEKFRTQERMEKINQQKALDTIADLDIALGFFESDDNERDSF